MIRMLGRFGCAEASEASGPAAAAMDANWRNDRRFIDLTQ
jgi:hypothetical protein